MGGLRWLKTNWRNLIIFATPLALLPLLVLNPSKESRCAFGLLLVAVYWLTEALPLPVTSLLPVLIFPLLGVAPSKLLCKKYCVDIIFLLLGGLLVAIAIEKSNLHRRFALGLLLLLGVQPRRLLFGFMAATGFLSMWISNTASTAMMIPIARALIFRLDSVQRRLNEQATPALSKSDKNGSELNTSDVEKASDSEDEEGATSRLSERSTLLLRTMSLAVCYSANCGGIGTLTGTAPNLVLKGQVDEMSGDPGLVTFLSWMVGAFPVAVVSLLLTWLWLQLVMLGPRQTFSCGGDAERAQTLEMQRAIRHDYDKLGKMSFAESAVLGHFLLLVGLWLTRSPGFFTGWGVVFDAGYMTDAVPSILIGVSLFVFPSKRPRIFQCEGGKLESPPAILTWPEVCKVFPWGVVLLLGGGFAVAEACNVSGLSYSVAQQLMFIRELPTWAAGLVLVVMASLATEITSNTVIATLFLPIQGKIAAKMGVNPLYFMLPSVMAVSFAFLFPVATPPNAIVFAFGDVKVSHMVKAGIGIKIITVALAAVAMNTYCYAYFNLGEFPSWAGPGLETESSSLNITFAGALNATHVLASEL